MPFQNMRFEIDFIVKEGNKNIENAVIHLSGAQMKLYSVLNAFTNGSPQECLSPPCVIVRSVSIFFTSIHVAGTL